jgi:hypothetical protein
MTLEVWKCASGSFNRYMVRLKLSASLRKQRIGSLFNRYTFGGGRISLFVVFCWPQVRGLMLSGKIACGAEGGPFGVGAMLFIVLAIFKRRWGGDAFLGKAALAAGWPGIFKSSECNSLVVAD